MSVQGDQTVVAGNYIGTDVTGSVVLGNEGAGVGLWQARGNVIGTDGDGLFDAEEGNVISGNVAGISIGGEESGDNVVAGNLIGTDATGTVALGNGVGSASGAPYGIVIHANSTSNRVGTDGDGLSDDLERNVISGNPNAGVVLSGGIDTVVAGNFIGTDITGTGALPNGWGVGIWGDSHSNLIGTDGDGIADDAERNVISANTLAGIRITGTDDNVIAGNFIGTDVSGTAALGNGTQGVWPATGILIQGGAQRNLVGTDGDGIADEAERNVISANNGDGVRISNVDTDNNLVAGNFIGTDVTGAIALGNSGDGVEVNGAQGNVIGGRTPESRNVISGNAGNGIVLTGSGATANEVIGNYVGLNNPGTAALGNAENGVLITNGANNNWIGTNGDGVDDAYEGNRDFRQRLDVLRERQRQYHR